MLEPWLELDGADDFLTELSQSAEVDLIALGTTGGAEAIKDTAVAQPLIVAASLLAARVLEQELGSASEWAGATAGHSVGEFAATAIAGVLSPGQATGLVGVRGRAMAGAAAEAQTGMAAVIGPDAAASEAAILAANLVPANINGAGQIVAAGTIADLEAFAAEPPARTRVIPLAVAGAFHTQHMAPAVNEVAAAAQTMTVSDPGLMLLSNADGAAVTSGQQMVDALISQITSPVRWDLCQESLAAAGVRGLIELNPGGVLTGLARRTLRGVPSVAIKSPADLDAAISLVKEHSSDVKGPQ